MTVNGRIEWFGDYLSDWDVPFVRLPGYETRGQPTMRPAGHVLHHDVSTGDLGALTAIRDGRAGLPGPLSHLTLPRGLTAFSRAVRIVATGRAHHAGQGGWRNLSGNSSVIGTEAASRGVGDWTDWQYEMWPVLVAAIADGLEREEGVAA